MSKKPKGYIKLYRQFFKHHYLWNEKRVFSKAEAWIDILYMARYSKKIGRELIGNNIIKWERGSFPASIRFLKKRWGWASNSKVLRFLKTLAKDDMIIIETGQGVNVIRIVNHALYNDLGEQEDTNGTPNGTPTEREEDANGTRREQNSKKEERKNVIKMEESQEPGWNGIVEIITESKHLTKIQKLMTVAEYKKLRANFSIDQIKDVIESLANWKGSAEKADLYLTALNKLKKNFGTTDVQAVMPALEAVYRSFVPKETGSGAKVDADERIALRKLAGYLVENNNIDDAKAGAIESFKYITDNWGELDNFTQKRIKIRNIYDDILSIYQQLNNANKTNTRTGTKKANQSARKDYGAEGEGAND